MSGSRHHILLVPRPFPSHLLPITPIASLLPLPPSTPFLPPLSFRPRYVWLQVVSAALMGTFYASRRTLSNTLWEPITLHAANNLFACLIPGGDPSVLSNPLFVGAVVHALLLHAYLCWRDIRRIVERRGREGGNDGDAGDVGDVGDVGDRGDRGDVGGCGDDAQKMRLQLLKEGRAKGRAEGRAARGHASAAEEQESAAEGHGAKRRRGPGEWGAEQEAEQRSGWSGRVWK